MLLHGNLHTVGTTLGLPFPRSLRESWGHLNGKEVLILITDSNDIPIRNSVLHPAAIRVTVSTTDGVRRFSYGRQDLQDSIVHRWDEFVTWIRVTRSMALKGDGL